MSSVIEIGDIQKYISENFAQMKEWIIKTKKINEKDYDISPEYYEYLDYKDKDGMCVSNIIVTGRYCPGKKSIVKFGLTGIQRNVENIRNEILNGRFQIPYNMKFDYADIIIFHELAHAYQDKHEKIKLRRDDVEIEQDADEKAIMWYSEYASQQGKSLEAINIIVEYYRKNRGKIK